MSAMRARIPDNPPMGKEPPMTLTTLGWIAMAFYAIHMIEEFMWTGATWRGRSSACWSRARLLYHQWRRHRARIAQAMLAQALPLAPLSFAGLLVNAVRFHIAPMIWTRGRYSPGVVTAVVLFLPLGIAIFWTALASGAATTSTAVLGLVIGAVLMAYPVAMLHLRSKPYFRQA
jgi:hypothetical protein